MIINKPHWLPQLPKGSGFLEIAFLTSKCWQFDQKAAQEMFRQGGPIADTPPSYNGSDISVPKVWDSV